MNGLVKEVWKEVERLLGFSEQQLRRWERQELVPHLDEFGFADLIALRSLQKLRQNHVPAVRIRRAVEALREKLKDVTDPLRELKIVCEGRKVAVLLDGQKMEPVSGQLLLNFDRAELKSLLSFPRQKEKPAPAARVQEAEDWFEKGLELERTGAPLADIMQAYQKAIELDPSSAGAHVNLGTIHYHLKSWADAERNYLKALEADPNYALAHFNLGNLFDERGERERALAHYHAAIQANPTYADAHYNLALLYQTGGDVLKAVRYWKSYLKLDGGSSWSAIARRELDKLHRETVVPGRENGT
jgi:tetratricopeptide (TPR) repeat protein